MALSRIVASLNLTASCRSILGINRIAGRNVKPYIYSARSYLPVASICINDKCNYEPRYVGSFLCTLHSRRHMSRLATSLVNSVPGSIQPYLKLLRLDKPIGSWLLFWPCAFSIGLAAPAGSFPDYYLLSLIGAGAIIMRGAGCIVNDLWDRDIDIKVERTKDRPLATGVISPAQAVVFLGGTLLTGLAILLQFNWYCILLGTSSLFLVTTYPLAKRLFNWPQLGLGLVFNWGALLGWAAVHGICDFSVCLPLYIGCISWTLVYDTVYAFQDQRDDARIGLKSTALTWDKNSKFYLLFFTGLMTTSFFTTGVICEQTLPYYTLIGGATSWLGYKCATLNTDDAASCNRLFVLNSLVGAVIMAGIVLGTLRKPKRKI